MIKRNKFRIKGSRILDDGKKPESMSDFLHDRLNPKSANTQMSESTFQENCNSTNKHTNKEEEKLGRLHVQIREDLISRLLETVFKRKKNIKDKKGATQRAVIEEALESYLE